MPVACTIGGTSDILPPMLRFAVILLLTALGAADVASIVRVDTGTILLEFDQRLHTRVSLRGASTLAIADWSASETVTVAGRDLQDFTFRKQNRQSVRDAVGSGRRTTVVGESAGVRKEISITAYESFPATVVLQVRYTNTGGSPLTIDKWTNHAYVIPARDQVETPFWSFQSGSYQNRPAWVVPLKAGFQQDNFQGMNSPDYGGGTPVSDVWRRDGGVAVGHVELVPKLVSLPVRMPDTSRATLAVTCAANRTLQPGETLETIRTFVTVHQG